MPTFPITPVTRVLGPATVVAIVVTSDAQSPLVITNNFEEGVMDVQTSGKLRTVAGAFWRRGPSLAEDNT